MQAFIVISYIAAAGCFAYAFFHRRITSRDLDIVALGLFFFVLPAIYTNLVHFVR